MTTADLASILYKIEEGWDAKCSDPEVTPKQAREWRVRQYQRLAEKAAAEESGRDAAPAEEKPSEGDSGQVTPAPTDAPKPLFEPRARSVGELLLPLQQGRIRSAARAKNLDADEVSKTFYGCEVHELSQAAGNLLLNYLSKVVVTGVKSA